MSYRELLRVRDYRLLFSGQVLSQVGDAIYEVGIVWLVYRMSSSAAALGALALCQSVPFLVLGLVAGAYADRWDRRVTMMVSDGVRGLAVLYLALRFVFGELSVGEVCGVAVVLTAARAFFHPAMRAMFPQVLGRERLLLANSLSEGAKRVCKVGGMMLGGLLMAWSAGSAVLWVNAGSFFLSLWTVWLIGSRRGRMGSTTGMSSAREGAEKEPASASPVREKRSVLRDIFAAGQAILAEKGVFVAILLSSVGLVVATGFIKVGLPLLAGDVLQAEGDVYGLLMACFSVGMFVSAAMMKRLARVPIVGLVALGWLIYGLMYVLIAGISSLGASWTEVHGWLWNPALWVVVPAVGVVGFAHFLTDVPVTALIQQRMPMERMSGCQSVWATASFGSESMGVGLAGVVLAGVPLLGGFAGAGVLLAMLGAVPFVIFRKRWAKCS
ncbi:MAG TPA: MFS transporter [Bacilli bacterium]|nr:MFS transporter [Bacilli bacterium]